MENDKKRAETLAVLERVMRTMGRYAGVQLGYTDDAYSATVALGHVKQAALLVRQEFDVQAGTWEVAMLWEAFDAAVAAGRAEGQLQRKDDRKVAG